MPAEGQLLAYLSKKIEWEYYLKKKKKKKKKAEALALCIFACDF